MSESSGRNITVGSAYNPPKRVELSSRVRELCPLLRSLPPDSSLLTIFIAPFRVVLAYLNGDTALDAFTKYNRDTSLLLLFASTWSLAARLGLPTLQNSLVAAMIDIYHETIQSREHYPADEHLGQAFRHLRDKVGTGSHAEKFLICFMGRTTPWTSELEKQLKCHKFEEEISDRILGEARSFSADPIKYTSKRFRVDVSDPPRYRPVGIQHARSSADQMSAVPELTLQKLQNLGRISKEKQGPRSVVSCASRNSFATAKRDILGQPQASASRSSSLTIVANGTYIQKYSAVDALCLPMPLNLMLNPVETNATSPAAPVECTLQQREGIPAAVTPRETPAPVAVETPANEISRDIPAWAWVSGLGAAPQVVDARDAVVWQDELYSPPPAREAPRRRRDVGTDVRATERSQNTTTVFQGCVGPVQLAAQETHQMPLCQLLSR